MKEIGLEPLLQRDRAIVAVALAVVVALAWIYVLHLAAGMDMGGMDMTGFRMISTGLEMAMAPAQMPWSGTEFVLAFAMWTVMMIGMMTPSAAPMILIYARAGRLASAAGSPFAATGWYVCGISRGLDRLCACRNVRRSHSGALPCSIRPWQAPATCLAVSCWSALASISGHR